MPRVHVPPSYRLHKARNSAVSTIDGANHYLGRYGSLESYRKYLDLLSGWITEKFGEVTPQAADDSARGYAISDLILAYWNHAKTYYVKRGQPTDEQDGIRAALRPLRQLYGHKAAAEFGPRDLKVVREAMIDADLSRKVVNQYVERIKRMFRWGVENELVPLPVFHAITEVAGLRKGRSRARETTPVRPVPTGDVEAVLPFLSTVLRAMVEFQRLTGSRPGETCLLRPGDIDRSGAVWCYRPHSFKTEHHEGERRVFIGPHAQAVLMPWLLRSPDAYCFSPRESVRTEKSDSGADMQSLKGPKKPRVGRRGECYTTDSYRRAVARACERAGVEVWAPNQLRHNCATDLRQRYGLEAAQTVLGHRKADVTQIYAERDFQRAEAIMREIG